MAGLRLVSVNIERAKHYARLFPFLHRETPDIMCFQELYERDIPVFEKEFGGSMIFAPNGEHPTDAPETGLELLGVGILTSIPVLNSERLYYAGTESAARSVATGTIMQNNPLVLIELEHEQKNYRIASTHFTWSAEGKPTDEQRRNCDRMIEALKPYDHVVLTGDFNAPRGGEIFTKIAVRLSDNIPSQYSSSIDGSLHRAGSLPHMVDGLFTTDEYRASDVRLENGVSDHCAIVADIVKV